MSQTFSNKLDRQVAIRQGKPIVLLGLTFYPIKMRDYEQFLACKDVLLLRLNTLPAKYLTKNYVNAIWTFEMDEMKKNNGANVGLFGRLIRLLEMSLRIDIDREALLTKQIKYRQSGADFEIDRIVITQDGKTAEITSKELSLKVRKLIAEQNGLELPKESNNPEVVKAEADFAKFKQERSGNPLKNSLTDLLASVAYQSHVSERELDDWTVREFENRRKAIERDKRFMLYGQAELSGMVSFKNGNPYQSWCFDSADDSHGMISAETLGSQWGNSVSQK